MLRWKNTTLSHEFLRFDEGSSLAPALTLKLLSQNVTCKQNTDNNENK